ncbi:MULTISPECIES: glycosyl hydrolase family 2 protein [Caproicibacterium]|uniref:Glycoside hydrolase n=1 Tax=Caproicibacterium argilliputei TaxID=3030016 RepID=A0AA97DA69_9FIRM|nr:hypothetical protein [Caproicibacterium argilliputei]WOC33131.1 hypothetical protein PXC00_04430 [Caproicibacterium argilliputei]
MNAEEKQEALTAEAFQTPPSACRSVPFFAWNCRLNLPILLEQVRDFDQMGFGGFCIHVRTGLDTPYLGPEFLEDVHRCEQLGESLGMETWLYDEDRWPSGAAGGRVTADPALRSRHLLLTQMPYGGDTAPLPPLPYSRAGNARTENGSLLCRYEIFLTPDGLLKRARRMKTGESAQGGTVWYAYLETQAPEGWYNGNTYIDTLNPKAVQAFLTATHPYYEALLGTRFGKAVPAIFCDEPQMPRCLSLSGPFAKEDVTLPWTDDLPETYRQAYGADLWEDLPLLLWEAPEGASAAARWRWHNHLADRFARGFLQPYGSWCRAHSLLLTGHLMEEPTLQSQTAATGDAMRCYPHFGLPGIDMLCGNFEFTTAKQCASVKNQAGKPGMVSETYGATGWDFDFRKHKLHGDWQAALGVTRRVLHLAWAGMAGESKRDYPASINYQSPWWREYRGLEEHFARVAQALTRGRPVVRVAVVHPLESFWMLYGPQQQTALLREQMDWNFQQLTQWLLFGGIDFDFLDEALLPELCPHGGAPLQVGKMQYDLVLVPACLTLRHTTLERLEAFQHAGGTLCFLGQVPACVDARPDARPAALAAGCSVLPLDRQHVLEAVSPVREVTLRGADGRLTENLLYQLRQDGAQRWLFLAHGREPENLDTTQPQTVQITLQGRWRAQRWDTMTGAVSPMPICRSSEQTTTWEWNAYAYDSLLLRLLPAEKPLQKATGQQQAVQAQGITLRIPQSVPVHLEEPNCLLLDTAAYALDGSDYQESTEILRIDACLRRRLSLPQRTDSSPQPWTVPKESAVHRVRLRFFLHSEVQVPHPLLTLEQPEGARIFWNGQEQPVLPNGWWVDHAIRTVPLPPLPPGKTVLEVELPFGRQTDLEWLYLLGGFGVRAAGAQAVVTAPVSKLAFGDFVPQGLPFYGGNVTYRVPLTLPAAGRILVEVPHYRGHLVTVSMDGGSAAQVFLPPYHWESSTLCAGQHQLLLTLFGNRFNQFGPLHLFDRAYRYMGPDSWRTRGGQWSDTWQFRRTGILSTPSVQFFAQET